MREHRAGLAVYLTDPEVPTETNQLERKLRVIPIGRKNWLFAWTEVGAKAAGILQNLLVTCRLHAVKPSDYLVDVLQRAGQHPACQVRLLTPQALEAALRPPAAACSARRTAGISGNAAELPPTAVGQRVVGIDVANEIFVAALMRVSNEVVIARRWRRPAETAALGKQLRGLGVDRIEAVLEPSATYGDSVRAGCKAYLISPKRVHDAMGVDDEVPSLQDAKPAHLIGRLHLEESSVPWRGLAVTRRDQRALAAQLAPYQSQRQRQLHRWAALRGRHWPEVGRNAPLGGHGSPAPHRPARIPGGGAPRAGRGRRTHAPDRSGPGQPGTHQSHSRQCTSGVACTDEEQQLLKVLGAELVRIHETPLALRRRLALWVYPLRPHALHDPIPQLNVLGTISANSPACSILATASGG